MNRFTWIAFAFAASFGVAQAQTLPNIALPVLSGIAQAHNLGTPGNTIFIDAGEAYNCVNGGPAALSTFSADLAASGCSLTSKPQSVYLNLNQFASQSDLNNLSVATNASISAQIAALSSNFNTQMAALNAQFTQSLKRQGQISNAGVAQALALGGGVDMQADENYAVAANFGTFGGQVAFAGSGAIRVQDHVAVNFGVTFGGSGGQTGGRAGIRFGW